MVNNILSFDVEEWNSSFYLDKDASVKESRVGLSINKILEILSSKDIKATFFVVGKLAEQNEDIVKMIDAAGHEVASHGYAHLPVTTLSPEEFRRDLKQSIAVLEKITNKKVLGYRAPGYTITRNNLWAIDIIRECGLRYDSSIYPVSLRVFTSGGAAGFQQGEFMISKDLKEFPLITADVLGVKLPVATTSYFRIFPYLVTKWAIKRLNQQGMRTCLNFHSWEFDPEHPKVKLPFPQNVKHYFNLSKTEPRFKQLISDFDFISCREAIE
ncbi:MAG: polysaccharide deacetylase family protein [Candidatus Margulisbacteria bacterium]|nr:polysaccharide deacetylase family protein [Candidatus Margulisiibacteriota bacterium]MBU1022128.1 polysaccharide deacetylase family protein [Candidatus Margulisiibacteriota bacterium]MBU1728644.1 polysaccharide deacetylase family protein [Candidatus Margulisiibacteriota bacterium]MBU1955095.1 polysaccharide deacetylase family protein [Candidatus Margulisiibacteriota bacterium]